jgi:acylphosphatase
MADIKSLHIRIHGTVQGVNFRNWLCETAEAHGVEGWVRNRSDGSVEAVFSGPASAVDTLLEASRSGPPTAYVTDITTEPTDAPVTHGFEKRPTV